MNQSFEINHDSISSVNEVDAVMVFARTQRSEIDYIIEPKVVSIIKYDRDQLNLSKVLTIGYEYVSILFIFVLLYVIALYYGRVVRKIFKTLGSDYLTHRFLDIASFANEQLNLRLRLLTLISGAFLVFRVHTDDIFDLYPFLLNFKIIISLLFVGAILWINTVLFRFSKVFFGSKWDSIKKLNLLLSGYLLFYIIVILLSILLSYVYPQDGFLISRITAVIGVFMIFIYAMSITFKYFYRQNVSFVQYILYFCTVKVPWVIFFIYYFELIVGKF